jgi:hypothetical protein
MAGLGVSIGMVMPEMLVGEAGRLPDVDRELELATAQRVVHRVLAMFESHYQRLNRMALSGCWAPGSPSLLMVKICIKLRLDSQAYKSTVVAKGPFFP